MKISLSSMLFGTIIGLLAQVLPVERLPAADSVDQSIEASRPEKMVCDNNVLNRAGTPDTFLREQTTYTDVNASLQILSNQYVEEGIRQYQLGAFSNAQRYLTFAIEADLSNARGYYNRGIVLLQGKRLNEAIEDFNVAIQIDRRYVLAYANRALAYERIGDVIRAKVDYLIATQLGMDCGIALHRISTSAKNHTGGTEVVREHISGHSIFRPSLHNSSKNELPPECDDFLNIINTRDCIQTKLVKLTRRLSQVDADIEEVFLRDRFPNNDWGPTIQKTILKWAAERDCYNYRITDVSKANGFTYVQERAFATGLYDCMTVPLQDGDKVYIQIWADRSLPLVCYAID